ncbi:MAG TPA: ABC transporter permease, partial [Gemmatimonadales bacterium]|nr:ABC transporter permease [Gemmatimonadales bacterium]
RSFFTLLGIIVSVGFLVTVVAVIQGMNAYVKENITGAVIGTNAFQVRRLPIAMGLFSDEEIREMSKRPRLSPADAAVVRRALPDAQAVSLQSGWPTPTSDITWRDRTVGDVLVFGVTPPYQIVQDYRFTAGEPLADPDITERRPVAVLGFDVAEKLFGEPERAIGRRVRIAGREMTVKAVTAKKGRVLGQSFDAFLLVPISTFETMYGRRKTTTISVKVARADEVPAAMARAEEALRVSRGLRPGEPDDFAVDKADALINFWKNLTRVLVAVIPAVVCIGIVVGGIVIMNIMLMSVNERTREIGIRKSLGATRADIRTQFLVEAVVLSLLGGVLGVAGGWTLAELVALITPLPARITAWSVAAAMALGAGTGILFGVYPATRAARLDPIVALRQE